MKELKCPKCGNAFTVDEADYAFILQQVKTSEFNAELERRLAEIRKSEAAESKLVATQQETAYAEALARKDTAIAALKSELAAKDNETKAKLLEKELEEQQRLS